MFAPLSLVSQPTLTHIGFGHCFHRFFDARRRYEILDFGAAFLVSAVLVPIFSLVGHEVWLLTANLRYRTSRPDAVATMTAVTYSAHGKARAVLEVGAVAQPQQPPAQGMLVIRVVAAALNPVDFKQLRNDQPDALVPKPRTLGFDVSGVVVAAGEGSGFDIGDAVYGMLPLVGSPWGALSEFTVAEAKCFAKAPRTIPLEQAAALPLVSLTVMQVFEQAGLLPGEDRKGQTILIQAAAGGVGSFAVQYARNVLGFGNVLGTCSAPNELLVRELGATATIDYTKTSFEEVAREAPDPSLACKCSSRRAPSPQVGAPVLGGVPARNLKNSKFTPHHPIPPMGAPYGLPFALGQVPLMTSDGL